MAEALFNYHVSVLGLIDKLSADSAGTASYHIGNNPDKRTVLTCVQRHIPIQHKARAICMDDFYNFDYIVCMDEQNLENVNKLCPANASTQIIKFGIFSEPAIPIEIPDPYYGGQEGFEEVFELLYPETEKLIQYIIQTELFKTR